MNQPNRLTASDLDGGYLTPIQVSVKTGIPKATLAKLRKDGRGPVFVKRGGRIEYPAQELEVWLRARRREQVWGPG